MGWPQPASSFCFYACGSGKTGASSSVRPVIGVKIYEAAGPFDALFREWRGLGVNTLFVSEALLQNPEALKEDPGLAAVTHYAAYLARFGTNIDILNYLATCHYPLGNREEAVKAWTKSLELSPNQEKIRALLESLKKK